MPGIRWKRFTDTDELRRALLREVPLGSRSGEVRAFLAGQRVTFADEGGGIVCATPARGCWPLISGQWLIEFQLSADRLTEVSVRLILTGP